MPTWDDVEDAAEAVVDVIAVGSGASGGAAAAIAAGAGASVLVLEKAGYTGGTTAKSGGVMWVPNNPIMRSAGIPDDRAAALRYLARTAYPTQYAADHPTLGLTRGAYRLLEAFYDHGCAVLDRLTELGAWELEPVPYPDYYADLPEDLAPLGRVIQPRFPDGWRRGIDPTGGQLLADALLRVAVEHGADVRTGAEVVHLVRDDDGRVIGVEARVGVRTAIFLARRGVIFGSGGFVHDRELARAYLRGPVLGGAASETASGDFVRIGIEAGAQLGNMSHAWWDQVVVEHAITVPSTIKDVYSPYGDSMLMVNKHGVRVVNEKAVYNERSQAHFAWDASRYEYPNLLLFWIFDQAVCDDPRVSRFRWPIPMPGEPFPGFVIRADTLDELAAQIRLRVAALAPHTGGLTVADGFEEHVATTIERFNGFAITGVDADFLRGESRIERTWAGEPREGLTNPTLAPLSPAGPYHCVILGPGALDTKGGPVIDEHARVVAVDGTPIPGLYGAGNCIASPAGQAYWGPGGTIGPAVVFGAIAAAHALTITTAEGT
jgi:succinate dehydrogenase/fumarate reductase flavoprotein subunit